jgi:hypothetical protein
MCRKIRHSACCIPCVTNSLHGHTFMLKNINSLFNNNNIYLLQMGCRPVAVVTYLATTTRDGRATWEACSVNLESWEPSQHLLIDTGKPRKTCVEMAGPRTSFIPVILLYTFLVNMKMSKPFLCINTTLLRYTLQNVRPRNLVDTCTTEYYIRHRSSKSQPVLEM